ncbi:MAG: hypothetical protein ACRDTG_01860 [Pseudonocardiaceae bacterium]
MAAPTTGRTLLVTNRPGAYPSISHALAEASPGAVISIAGGIYAETVELAGAQVTLVAADGAQVIIDGSSTEIPALLARDQYSRTRAVRGEQVLDLGCRAGRSGGRGVRTARGHHNLGGHRRRDHRRHGRRSGNPHLHGIQVRITRGVRIDELRGLVVDDVLAAATR